MPTADVLKAYCGYGDLVEYSFEPYIATASAPIIESYLSYSMNPLERLQPNAGLLFSTNGKLFLRENPTITSDGNNQIIIITDLILIII